MFGSGTARLRLKMVAVTGVAAAAASACGFYVNDDGSITLQGDSVADTYPSVNVVSSTDAAPLGNELLALFGLFCGVSTPTDNTADIVLQSPSGESVLLTTGQSFPTPTDVLAVPEFIFGPTLTSLNRSGGRLSPAAVQRHGGFYVPKGQRVRVLRQIARRMHVPGARLLHPASLVPNPFDDTALTDCIYGLEEGGGLFIADTTDAEGVSLPSPAPAGPYDVGLDSFNGEDPVGTWRLWINSVPVPEYSSFQRVRPATSGNGSVDSWYLIPFAPYAEPPTKPFSDDSDFTVTGDDTEASPLTFTMHVEHKDGKQVTPTGQVQFIECTTPLCDGNTVGTARLNPDELGASTATLVLDPDSVPAGDHRYQAKYFGDDNFDGINSDPVSVTLP